ncbi:hypothetical protein CP532_4265 [Ophiocordyceps camponoti-leonardi (nom. inval.)]|nr:hypothetical protein CP532_4265 [Ophiocordyceps camponoti-leonardi (nom. inval.)]
MVSKTTIAMLGALASYQGVSANLKPIDQAVKDGNLPVDKAEAEFESCGGKKIDPTSSKPCDIELVENAKLFGIVTAMKDKSDATRAKGWLELWEKSPVHHARECCIQCKLDVWHKSGKAAGMTPHQAQVMKTEFYSREKYLDAWKAPDANFTELMDEWSWRSSRTPWPAAEADKSEQDVKFVRDETCPSLPGEPKTELPKEALGQTLICPTMPTSFSVYESTAVNVTGLAAVNITTNVNVNTEVNVYTYLQPRYCAVVLSDDGLSGSVVNAPAEKIDQAPSKALVKDLSPQVVRKDACNVCVAGPAKPASQILQSKPTSEEISNIKSEVQVKGSVDVNILVSHAQTTAAKPSAGEPYKGTEKDDKAKPRPVQPSAKFGPSHDSPAPKTKAEPASDVAVEAAAKADNEIDYCE